MSFSMARTFITLNSILVVTVTKEHCHLVVCKLHIHQNNQAFRNKINRYNLLGHETLHEMIARLIFKNLGGEFKSLFVISELV